MAFLLGTVGHHHIPYSTSIILNRLKLFCAWHCFGGLGITGGSHRLWSHKAYTAGPAYRIFLMLMNCIAF